MPVAYDFGSAEFDAAVRAAGCKAFAEALASGVPVFYIDAEGLDVMERNDGRRFEIRWLPGAPSGENYEVIRELTAHAAQKRACPPAVGPDAIAIQLNPLNPSAAAIATAKHVLNRTAAYLNQGASFAVETTLSSRGRVDLLRKAKSRGYKVHLVFIAMDSPERCIARIRHRAERGGHFVPDADVRRRYFRSIANAANALRLADFALFYDNSGDSPRLVLVAEAGEVRWQAEVVPEWIKL